MTPSSDYPPHPAFLRTATTAVRVFSNFSGLQIDERPKSFQFEELGMGEHLTHSRNRI